MKTKLFFLVLAIGVFACTNENTATSEFKDSENSKMQFTSIEDFDKTIRELNELSKIPENLTTWIETKKHNSLLMNLEKFDNEQTDALPTSLLAILNTNFEFQIGENTIYYKNGKFYEYKGNSSEKKVEIIGTSDISNIKVNDENAHKILGSDDLYKEWVEFNRINYRIGCDSPFPKSLLYRLVHELKTIKTVIYGTGFSELSMNFRMSFKTSSWKDNNQTERLLSFDLTGTFQAEITGPFGSLSPVNNFHILDNFGCSNPAIGNKRYVLATGEFVATLGQDMVWFVTVNGPVSHQVNGDNGNVWNHNIFWL